MDPLQVVFDPSLLIPPANTFVDEIQYNEFLISLTGRMYNVLTSKESEDRLSLLTAWGAKSADVITIEEWLREKARSVIGNHILEFDPPAQESMGRFRFQIKDALREYLGFNEKLLEFVCDEICLAIYYKIPILCAESSSWKIVELLRKSGAQVKEELRGYGEKKAAYFKKREAWKEAAAAALGIAFVWLIGSPVTPAMAGLPIIKVLVKDP